MKKSQTRSRPPAGFDITKPAKYSQILKYQIRYSPTDKRTSISPYILHVRCVCKDTSVHFAATGDLFTECSGALQGQNQH